MRKFFIFSGVAAVAGLIIALIGWRGAIVAASPYYEPITNDKGEAATHVIAAYRSGDFWQPVTAVVAFLGFCAAMALVSNQRSKFIPGTVLGILVGVAVCLFGRQFLPSGDTEAAMFMKGGTFIGLVLLGFGVLLSAFYLAFWLMAKKKI